MEDGRNQRWRKILSSYTFMFPYIAHAKFVGRSHSRTYGKAGCWKFYEELNDNLDRKFAFLTMTFQVQMDH